MTYYSCLDRKKINSWLNDKKRHRGCNRLNVKFLRDVRECDNLMGEIAIISYFLTVHAGVQRCRTIMDSAKKQRTLLWAVRQQLKEWAVTPEYEKVFRADLTQMRHRVEHAKRILKENIRLSKYAPYFYACGYEKLYELCRVYGKEARNDYAVNVLMPEIEAWNAAHEHEVAAHVESIRCEIETMERHKREVKEREKAEKQAARDAKKAETAEIREMRKNAEAYRRRQSGSRPTR